MKKLMEDLEGKNINSIYYCMSVGVRVGHDIRDQAYKKEHFGRLFMTKLRRGSSMWMKLVKLNEEFKQ